MDKMKLQNHPIILDMHYSESRIARTTKRKKGMKISEESFGSAPYNYDDNVGFELNLFYEWNGMEKYANDRIHNKRDMALRIYLRSEVVSVYK